MKCANNLKQIGLAIHNYHAANQKLPVGAEINTALHCERFSSGCRGNDSWLFILPYLEQDAVYRQYDQSMGHAFPFHKTVLNELRMPMYVCPSADGRWGEFPNRRDYFGVAGGRNPDSHGWRGDVAFDGLYAINRWRRMSDISDGTSNTLMVGESVRPKRWGMGSGYGDPNVGGPSSWLAGAGCSSTPLCGPKDQSYDHSFRNTKHPINATVPLSTDGENDVPFSSQHPGGAQFVFSDGHVALLRESLTLDTFKSLGTYAGGEVLGNDW
jgi:prepilin-type processing-associated H-X9-DG protein